MRMFAKMLRFDRVMGFSVRPDFFLNFWREFQSSSILSILNFWLCPFAWDLQLYISLAGMGKNGQKQPLGGFLKGGWNPPWHLTFKYAVANRVKIVQEYIFVIFRHQPGWHFLCIIKTYQIELRKKRLF